MSQSASSIMMQNLTAELPNHILYALETAPNFELDKPDFDFNNVVILGMGGSGIGGVLVKNWIAEDIAIPVICVQDYFIPNFVDNRTLVIASSYSGNTEETLMALEDAQECGAFIVGITSGGKLESFCKENKYPVFIVPGGNPPRTALGYSLVMLLTIFERLELVSNRYTAMIQQGAQKLLKNQTEMKEQGKKVAEFFQNKIPIFYATPQFEGLAIRCRQQINENSKSLGWSHIIPEMNHNELVGWTGGSQAFAPLFLLSQNEFNRNLFRIQISKEEMESRGSHTMTLVAQGDNPVEEVLYLNHIVDWASVYFADLRNQDPEEIPVIIKLKSALDDMSNE